MQPPYNSGKLTFSLEQVNQLQEFFSGDEGYITVEHKSGYGGLGLYAHSTAHPELGSVLLVPKDMYETAA